MEILKTRRSYKKELRRQIRLAITAAIGFTVAFAWRNAIFDSAQSFVSRLLDLNPGHYMTETYTAIFLTLFGVLLIFLTARILREKN